MTDRMDDSKQQVFCSWSGGKDSCLALHRAIKRGVKCSALFTMLVEDGSLSRSHGQSTQALEAQADALGIPLRTARASWADYEDEFKKVMRSFASENITGGVFGDIDLEPHREWIERVCGESDVRPQLPLWKGDRRELVEEFVDEGYKAVIVAINASKLDASYLGEELDFNTLSRLEKDGVDLCGEKGEFHTYVSDGPLFNREISFETGPVMEHKGYQFVQLRV